MVESDRSIIYDQAENRLDAQKAIMLHLLHDL
jgi:ornithine carbamoyltransferase